MMKVKKLILTVWFTLTAIIASGQIGYQVSLLDRATGEPRSNESVSVDITITDVKGNVICKETKKTVSNDFGVVSLSIGNSDTFTDVDWNNLPLFIEASVEGRLIGKSQILSIPVAEHAKHTGLLTRDILTQKTWRYTESGSDAEIWETITFHSNGSAELKYGYVYAGPADSVYTGKYIVDGNVVVFIRTNGSCRYFHYFPDEKILCETREGYVFK